MGLQFMCRGEPFLTDQAAAGTEGEAGLYWFGEV
jgi:hypothetical protein